MLTTAGARLSTQRPPAMQPIAPMAAHGQAGSREWQTPTPWQTLHSTSRWIHTSSAERANAGDEAGRGDGAHLDQNGYGTRKHACHEGGADANTLLAGRRSREHDVSTRAHHVSQSNAAAIMCPHPPCLSKRPRHMPHAPTPTVRPSLSPAS